MQTMTAFVLPEPRSQSITHTHVAVPRPAPNELLVRVKAIGVGVHDSYFLPREMSFPYPSGSRARGLWSRSGTASAATRAVTASRS